MVYPYLTYCNLVWGNTYNTRLQSLFRTQKKILKIMTFQDYRQSSRESFKKLEILTLQQINIYLASQFMYKYKNSLLPNVFTNFFILNSDIHTHNTRSSSKIHLTQTRTNYKKQSLRHYGAQIWNQIENTIQQSKTLNQFKNRIRKTLLYDKFYMYN